MSGIVLSASVRQNLLSLQSTAALLATTQNDLATGNKVNSALDNPTNFFTAEGLNNRASDIGNLLDSIGNGVQVLQAANTGITSLQGLVSSAQSIANQVLQTPVGYSTKSNITSVAINGASANNLLGSVGAATNASAAATSALTTITSTAPTNPSAATTVTGTGFATVDLSGSNNAGFTLNVDGTSHAITLNTAAVAAFTTAGGTISGTNATLSATDISKIIDFQYNSADTTGTGPVTVSGGQLQIASATTGASSQVTISGLSQTGVTTGLANVNNTGAAATSGTALTFKVNNQTVTLAAGSSYTGAQVASAINGQVTGVSASYSSGKLVINSTGTAGSSDTVTVGTFSTGDATQLGFGSASVSTTGTAATGGLSGETLTIQATGGGTATNITFGTAQGDVSTLNELNTALAANNLQATIDSSTGKINIVTSNDAAASTIGAIGGTATATGSAFAGASAAAPVADPTSQATRASLVAQYNQVLQQINTTSQDSSFNGINLLNGDTLKLTFNETGTSTLNITGVTFNGAGLGLSTLTSGTSFLDNSSANNVLSQLQDASTTLRSEASALGSNLSIVEIRQDFNKNLINVLQTGASNLTLADPNQEAADSQALSTRQSIAVSALALANQSQESVLQLLR
jgi:hypothetical protein